MTEAYPSLLAALKIVGQLRAKIASLKAIVATEETKLEVQMSPITEEIKTREYELQAAEDTVRAIALGEFKRTGEKSLAANVKVREYTNLIFDEEKAQAWCEINMPVTFKRVWNKKLFMEFARKNELPFVTKELIPEALLPREISIEEAVSIQ